MNEFAQTPEKKCPSSAFICPAFLFYQKFSGLCPFATDKSDEKRNLAAIWSWMIAVFVSTLSVINFADYTMYFLDDIESLEFFKLIAYFVRADLTLQTVAIFVIVLVSRQRISDLLDSISVLLNDLQSREQMTKIRRACCVLALGWIALWQCMHLFGYVAYIWDDLWCAECLTRFTPFLSKKDNIPTYLDYLITGSSKLLDTNIELTAQCFYFMLIYLMGTGFDEINQRLQYAKDSDSETVQIEIIRESERLYLRLRTVMNKFNDCFGLIGLLIFLRDVFSFMFVPTLTLQVHAPREPGESLEEFQGAMKYYEAQAKHDIVVGVIGLANAMVQTTLCLRCHGKVQAIRKTLQELEATAKSPATQEKYQGMWNDIDTTDGAISSSALYITKESIASSFGLLAGYAVLIYQTRDAIVSDQQYAKKSDLLQLAGTILDLLQNQSASVYPEIRM